jgi:hypothetical protein
MYNQHLSFTSTHFFCIDVDSFLSGPICQSSLQSKISSNDEIPLGILVLATLDLVLGKRGKDYHLKKLPGRP